jgi:hypothetical protein
MRRMLKHPGVLPRLLNICAHRTPTHAIGALFNRNYLMGAI